jgi:hypothetical protein
MSSLSTLFQGPTRIRPTQIDIISLFSVIDTLKQRGFNVRKESSLEETLLYADGRSLSSANDFGEAREFLEKLNSKRFRVAVRRTIYDGLNDTSQLQGFDFAKSIDNEQRYAKTMELLIAYLCIKEFSAFSASFGVDVQGSPAGGDLDCVANFQGLLYHFEIKSGAVNNITSDMLQQFLFRHDFLSPEVSILFLDYSSVDDDLIKKFLGLKLYRYGKRRIVRIHKHKSGGKRVFMIEPGILVVDIGNDNDTLTNIRFAMRFLNRYNACCRSLSMNNIFPEWGLVLKRNLSF